MRIETGSFFLLVATLAAGGGAGYFASQKHVFDRPPTPPPSPDPIPVASTAAPAVVAPLPKPAAPACEDAVGTPGACPPPGYSADEGGCGGLPSKRCSDFKQTMKPRVAERAVACLNALKPNERCDPNRLNLCGHLALMSACPEPDEADRGDGGPVVGVGAVCQSILSECAGAPLGPTLRDCRATLAGMSDLGQSRMLSCMATHCTDKSLLYCEGVVDVK
jgi:hypothetical protein